MGVNLCCWVMWECNKIHYLSVIFTWQSRFLLTSKYQSYWICCCLSRRLVASVFVLQATLCHRHGAFPASLLFIGFLKPGLHTVTVSCSNRSQAYGANKIKQLGNTGEITQKTRKPFRSCLTISLVYIFHAVGEKKDIENRQPFSLQMKYWC